MPRCATGALALAAAALLAANGCGGGDAPGDAGEATGGAAGAASYDVSAAEFLAELRPGKERILAELLEAEDICPGVEADAGFALVISAAAAKADPDSALPEVVEGEC